jgi:hypothetical protein
MNKKEDTMSGKVTMVEEMGLGGTKNGKITVTVVEEPYGEGSDSVASIGISLQANAEEPDWKVHLPKENIDAVIAALQKAKESL